MAKPTVRELAKQLRAINEAYSHPECGGEFVELCHDVYKPGAIDEWCVLAAGSHVEARYGWEWVPGDDTFDAMAAARRLLAAVP